MEKTSYKLLLFSALSIFLTEAKAEETFSKDFFDLELFSLSKRTEDAFDSSAAVYIVTAEDIRRSGASILPDVLRMVPGMQVAQQNSHNWAITSRGFATQFTNKLLVMVDGRVVYKPLFSGVFWDLEDMPLENIDRIEVIRGPGGTIWGSNAVGGIINIITKKAVITQGDHFSAEAGNRGDRTVNITHGGMINTNDAYRLYFHSADHPTEYTKTGQSVDDGWKLNSGGFRYDINHLKSDIITIQGDFKDGYTENYFSQLPTTTSPFVLYKPLSKSQQNANILAKWDHKISENSSTHAQFYIDYDRLRTTIVNWDGYTVDADFQHDWRINDIHQVTSGLGLRYMIGSQQNRTTWIVYRNTLRHDPLYSAFLQDKIRLIPNKMFLTLGSKVEHNDATGLEYQPSARLTYYPDDNQTLWASVTRAVRTPSVGEQDAVIKLVGSAGGYVARNYQDGYDSEELVAYELGYRTIPYDQLLIESTVFYSDFSKLRTLEQQPAFGDIISPNGTRNNGYGNAYGFEVNTKFQAKKNWRLQASYSFMQMNLHLQPGVRDNTFTVQEKQAPNHQYSLNSFYNIRPDIEFDTSLYYVGDIVGLTAAQPINAYFRLDTRLAWHVQENWEISLIGHNLLDDRHQEYQQSLYALPQEIGRSVIARVSIKF